MDQTSETEKVYQKKKYEEIIEILLTAGYFRARINTLSEFDKVVGGLCWCITSSGESVDVDILFQENSSIGQKIALSEAIVVALRKMGCPCPIQPHQIQGGVGGADYPAIYHVIVWLVKKYFERRSEREQLLRAYSMFQFSKNYQLPEEKAINDISPILSKILDSNKAVRLYKRKSSKTESEETRVRSCLLEFGESFAKLGGAAAAAGGAGSSGDASGAKVFVTSGNATNVTEVKGGNGGMNAIAQAAALRANNKTPNKNDPKKLASGSSDQDLVDGDEKLLMHVPVVDAVDQALADLAKLDINELSGFEKQLARAAKEAKRDELLFAEKASKEETEIMKQMSEVDENTATVISGSQVGNIVGLGADEITSANAAYQAELEESKKQLDINVATGRLGAAAAFTRQKQHLLKKQEEFMKAESEAKAKLDTLNAKLRTLEEEKSNASDYILQLKNQNKKFIDLEKGSAEQKELATIKNLINLNEQLKLKEVEFKTKCKAKRQEYLDKIKVFDAEESEDTAEMKQQKEIEEMYVKVVNKYNHLRQMLAEANREVALAVRVIDDTPTRTELIQYERRFVELYQQVAAKLEETRKYYDMYNILETTLGFIQKEIKLLNSISENFNEAMKSATSKAEFSKQFENIFRGVEESLKRQENTLMSKQQVLEQHKQVYQTLVDEQRKYYKAVKDFQDECNKNEWLMAKLEELQKK